MLRDSRGIGDFRGYWGLLGCKGCQGGIGGLAGSVGTQRPAGVDVASEGIGVLLGV